ncbi:CRS2-associated factor 2, chloroplastic, partial [Mucuna pruriens]
MEGLSTLELFAFCGAAHGTPNPVSTGELRRGMVADDGGEYSRPQDTGIFAYTTQHNISAFTQKNYAYKKSKDTETRLQQQATGKQNRETVMYKKLSCPEIYLTDSLRELKAKNGVYTSLVKDVRDAFEGSILVKINCKGLDPSDYKKLGAKLKDLVPCVLLSFDDEQILMWRGKDWKSRYPQLPVFTPSKAGITGNSENSGDTDDNQSKHDGNNVVNTSPKMLSLWKRAIESSKALLLDELNLGPDALLEKVEEFEAVSQAMEHSHPAFSLTSENDAEHSYASHALPTEEDEEDYVDYHDDQDDDLYDVVDTSAQPGSLPVDIIVKNLKQRPLE